MVFLSKRKQASMRIFASMPMLCDKRIKLHKERRPCSGHKITNGIAQIGAIKAAYAVGYTHKEHSELEKSLAFSGASFSNSLVANTTATRFIGLKKLEYQRTLKKMRV